MVAQRVFLAPILDLAIRDARKRKVYHFQGKKVFFFLLSSLVEPQYYVGKVRCSQGMARNSICILYENL